MSKKCHKVTGRRGEKDKFVEVQKLRLSEYVVTTSTLRLQVDLSLL